MKTKQIYNLQKEDFPLERIFDFIIDDDGMEWCEFKLRAKVKVPFLMILEQIEEARRATEQPDP